MVNMLKSFSANISKKYAIQRHDYTAPYSVAFYVVKDGKDVARKLREDVAELNLPRGVRVTVTCLTDVVRKDSHIRVTSSVFHGKLSYAESNELKKKLGYKVATFIEELR